MCALRNLGKVATSLVLTVWVFVGLCLAPRHAEAQVSNTVVVNEKSGTNYVPIGGYPFQIGRVFQQGEIANLPEMLSEGVLIAAQQATVTTRWPDGSAKFVILCALLPLQANQRITITFRNRATPFGAGLTQAQMLATDFDARMTLTSGGVPKSASARTMLQNGHYTTWFSGPVATSIVLADHSAARTYDIGFGANRPFRPAFHATFWPSLGAIQVRAIGELSNTQEIQSMPADVLVTLGQTSPTTLISEANVPNISLTRWSRTGWIGRTPGRLNINYNLAYLAATKAIPNYDSTLTISEGTIAAYYSAFQGLNKALYAQSNAGSWHTSMGDVGGRPDIGPFPAWYVAWLYTGDWRLKEYCDFLSAQYGSLVPQHFREGADKNIVGTTPGRGRIVSIVGRPTMTIRFFDNNNASQTKVADRFGYFDPYSRGGVIGYDDEHLPHPYPIAYLLTGDFFYLEQLWFAASAELGWIGWGYRGPTGSTGSVYVYDPRSMGWGTVARFEAAYFSPDNTPEKAYFTEKSIDTAKIFDGYLLRQDSPYVGDPVYQWAYWASTNNIGGFIGGPFSAVGLSPLGWWIHQQYPGGGIEDPAKTKGYAALWMQGFIAYMAGRATELGFEMSRARNYLTFPFVDMVVNSPQPTHVGQFNYPTSDSTGQWFTSWNATVQALYPQFQGPFTVNTTDFEHSYFLIAMTAASFGEQVPKFTNAWSWYLNTVYNPARAAGLSNNPKWAILPRGAAANAVQPSSPRNLRLTPE